MKKYTVLTVCGAMGILGSLWLSACSAQPSVQIPSVLQVQNLDDTQSQRVTVQASESVKVTPDMAEITFVVRTDDVDAGVCQQENAKKLEQVVAYLKEQGFSDESIQTSRFSLDTRYDWSGNVQKIAGYEMRTQVEVTDIPVGQAGTLLSGAVEAGADEIQNVSYFATQYDAAYEEALAKAMDMALSKAEALAHAGGGQVTDVLNIQEFGDTQTGRYVAARNLVSAKQDAGAGAVADMEVMPGEMEVKAEIEVTYRLLPQ